MSDDTLKCPGCDSVDITAVELTDKGGWLLCEVCLLRWQVYEYQIKETVSDKQFTT